ncbi:hypothetical protein [Mycobacterium sp.]|uniref:hypothetical protein n=1 Tax=Mycobacterium sp. TaxID=1785 RepID=UPI00121894A2|nr:hypothetical protein [Mycobacterium sp.]TAM69848.1 MAG: hypothetical protein EPN51_08860 [Mycobacterium sp.]
MAEQARADAIASADKQWRRYTEPLLELGGQVAEMWPEVDDDPQLRAELLWFLYSEIGAGFMTVAWGNDHHPDFFPCWGQVFNNGGNINPDGVYYLSPIDDAGVYKLAGFRGTLRVVDLQLGDGSVFAWGKLNDECSFGPTLANFDLDDNATIDENGWFEVILSQERPAGWTGDWWKLPPKTNYLLVRQFAYDWINEVDARIAIDRLDTPAAKPRRTAEEIQGMLDRVPEFMYASLRTLDVPIHAESGLGSPGLVNNLVKIDYAPDQAGRAGQWYIAGRFDLQPDEALILEIAPGECRYWNLQLANEVTNTLDFYNRLIGINGSQAEPDAAGVFRVVVSDRDPGVWNWLDTVGHRKGFLWGRMDRTNDYEPKAKLVKFANVRAELGPDVRHVTPAQREAEIRKRRMGAQLRRRW